MKTALLDAIYGAGGGEDGHVQAIASGSDVLVQVDVDSGGGTDWQDVAILQDFSGGEVNVVLKNLEDAASIPVA